MYRTLGTRGSVFGVPSGPYAGKERAVSFARLPEGSKRRLVDAIAGRSVLTPILRPGAPRRALRALALLPVSTLVVLLFAAGWPRGQTLVFGAAQVIGVALLAWMLRDLRRQLVFEGTRIETGAYLFPLDVVEAGADGVLRLVPLGKVREAAVATVASRPALLLTFEDRTTRAFPTDSPKEAEAAFDAMERAQKALEKLTYDRDLEAAVHLDPFFEVRMDDSWESAAPDVSSKERRRTMLTVALGATLGLALFGVRSLVGVRAEMRSRERALSYERARREAEATELTARPTPDKVHLPDAALRPDERAAREAQRLRALEAFRARAKSPEIAALVTELVDLSRTRGRGIQVYFTRTCQADPGCLPWADDLLRYEDRVTTTLQAVLSETIPRSVLALDLRTARLEADDPSLEIDYLVTGAGEPGAADAGAQALVMRFHARLRVPGARDAAALPAFALTMPAPRAPVTALRERSIFVAPQSRAPESLVFARGFDRLYDELYGLFLEGAPRVPLHGSAEEREADEKLRESFGLH